MQMQAWAYPPELPDNIQPICDLLYGYSQIPKDDVRDHLLRIVSMGISVSTPHIQVQRSELTS